jgi:methylase of polypeptide subunit release factors
MAPMMADAGANDRKLVDPNADRKLKILDIAAGHGLFGIGFAQNNPQAEIHAVDWKAVLEVAKENAQKAGVADRYHTDRRQCVRCRVWQWL